MTRSDDLRDAYRRSATEDELLTAIVDAAQYQGWQVHHTRRSDLGIVQGDPGFPDLVLARLGFVLFLELKADAGRPTTAQTEWINALGASDFGPGRRHVAMVVYPRDLDRVLEMLRDG